MICAFEECKNEFDKNKHNQIYCSIECKKRRDYIKNIDAYKKRAEKHRDKNRVAWNEYANKYYHEHKEECLIKMRARRKDPQRMEIVREQKNKRYKTNIQYKLNHNISGYIRKQINKRLNTNIYLLKFGYTVDDLKIHLEKQFQKNMTWENYGTFWSIDHKIPSFWFNCENEIELNLCWSLENLKPEYWKINCGKGARYAEPTTIQLQNPIIIEILKRNNYRFI